MLIRPGIRDSGRELPRDQVEESGVCAVVPSVGIYTDDQKARGPLMSLLPDWDHRGLLRRLVPRARRQRRVCVSDRQVIDNERLGACEQVIRWPRFVAFGGSRF